MKLNRMNLAPMDGVPRIRGLRISTIVGMIAEGMSKEEILKAHRGLEADDIREALWVVVDTLKERELSSVHILSATRFGTLDR